MAHSVAGIHSAETSLLPETNDLQIWWLPWTLRPLPGAESVWRFREGVGRNHSSFLYSCPWVYIHRMAQMFVFFSIWCTIHETTSFDHSIRVCFAASEFESWTQVTRHGHEKAARQQLFQDSSLCSNLWIHRTSNLEVYRESGAVRPTRPREEISDGCDLNIGARMVKKRQLELQPHSTCSNL